MSHAARRAPAAAPSPVVYLEPPPVEGPNDPVTGRLCRELHRQVPCGGGAVC